jgi:hypothetical protein
MLLYSSRAGEGERDQTACCDWNETPYIADVVALFPTHLQPDNIEIH